MAKQVNFHLQEKLAARGWLFTSHALNLSKALGHGANETGLSLDRIKELCSEERPVIGAKCGIKLAEGRYNIVLDADRQYLAEWLQKEYPDIFGATLTTRGSKGAHFYFETDKPAPKSSILLSKEKPETVLDILGAGSMAVMPPSPHRKTMEQYIILRNADPLFVSWAELETILLHSCHEFDYHWKAIEEKAETKEIKRDETAEMIKAKLTIFDIDSSLKSGLQSCPLPGHAHGDRHPSLSVREDGRLFNCFGQHGGGDIFTWIMKRDNVEFPEAMKTLRMKAGIDTAKETAKEKTEKGNINADQLIPEGARFFLDQHGAAFIRLERGGHFEIWPVKGGEFRRLTTRWLLNADKRPSSDQITQIKDIAEARAFSENQKHSLFVRCARGPDNAIYLDLCDEGWRVVKITPGKWELLSDPPVIFRRYPHMKALEIEHGTKEDFEAYLNTLNLSSENGGRILLAGYICALIVPGIPHAILLPHGPQGSAKTSLSEAIRLLFDDSQILSLAIPHDKNELYQQLMHHYNPVYDNARELGGWQQDALCRASTGEGFSKRELYSDDGDVVYNYQRVVIMNGINIPGQNPDFLDRSLMILCDRIPETKRLRLSTVRAKQRGLAPKARGYLLDVVAHGLAILPEVPDKNLPRMADFAHYAEAFCRAAGYESNEFLDKYKENISAQHEEAISGSVLGSVVRDFITEELNFEGTPAELLERLEKYAEEKKIHYKDKSWPKTPSWLIRKLNTYKTTLAELGIEIETTLSGTRKIHIWKKYNEPQKSLEGMEGLP